ncbi:MAG TPA: helix-turn-helix transcriptional regulator [Caulobacteraceae bacterium]
MSDISEGFSVRSLAETYRDGGHIGRHHHPWGQLAYATKGVMRVVTPSVAWLSPPTRAIWLPPRLTHEIWMQGETALRTLYIAPGPAAALPLAAVVLEVAPLLRELILHILTLGMLARGRPEHDRLCGLLVDLLVQARPQDLALPLPRDRRALVLAERLRAAPEAHTELGALAREAGASLRTFQRLFPRETGLTVEAWRQKARLIHAIAALSGDASVTNAALDCGYDSQSAFITAFRRQFGVTPGRYPSAR